MIKKLRNQPYAPKWEQEEEKNKTKYVGFEAFVAMTIFRDMTMCDPLLVH
jgi:hypothetical protein